MNISVVKYSGSVFKFLRILSLEIKKRDKPRLVPFFKIYVD